MLVGVERLHLGTLQPELFAAIQQKIAAGRNEVIEEIGMFTRAMRGDYLAGPLSAADFALYPLVAFLPRAQMKIPDLDADGMFTPALRAWKARIEALPYFERTIPPHWKKP
jgi:glutathione S-transferase